METVAHEREVQLLQAWPWPCHVMATTVATAGCSPDDSTDYGSSSGGSSASGDCFVLGWEPPLLGCCFDVHELFPLFADTDASSLLPVPSPPPARDVVAVPQDLDDLLDFWDASCHDGDVGAQQHQVQVAFNSGCCLPLQLPHETSSGSATSATTTNSFFPCDDYDDPLSSIFQTGPALAEKALLLAPSDPPSSSSSNSHADPCGSDASGAKLVQCTAATPSAAGGPPPPPRSSSSSLKRTTTREAAESESGGNGKRRRKASTSGVVRPFALLKPDGLDGGATLADINARVLTRPARPVRHPVGEFACAPPRASAADRPGISGKPVSSFTRLHTPGRGTITVIRTRG